MDETRAKRAGLGRRSLLRGVLLPAVLAPIPQASRHPFDGWIAERAQLDAMLDHVPESDEAARAKIYDRYFEVERLIIATPCLELPAIRAKAALLCWQMEMESDDGLPAMRHIQAFLERAKLGA